MRKYFRKFLIISPLMFAAMAADAAAEALLDAVELADHGEVERLLLDNNNSAAINELYDFSRQFSLPFDPGMTLIVKKFTLLHIAAGWGDLPMVELLLKHNANPRIPDENGIAPVDIPGLFISHESRSRNYLGCLDLLIKYSKGG